MGIFKEYFLNSSLHGLHFIVDRRFHWTERLFWVICVALSWTAALALTLSAIQQYQSQKISFSVDTAYLEWKTNFPSIIVCEKFNEKKMDEANHMIFGNILERIPKLEQFVFFDGSMRYEQLCLPGGRLRDKCLLGNYSTYMHKFRSTCSEVIASCFYNGEEFSCCDEFLPVLTFHGLCLAFNSLIPGKYATRNDLPFKITRHLGHPYGNLSLELLHTGVKMFGLSQDSIPTRFSSGEYALLDSDSSQGISPRKHYRAFLSVKETFTDETARLMNIENRGCRFYDENNLRHLKIYSTSACETECLVEAQKEVCNCCAHTLPHNDEVKECGFEGLICTVTQDSIIMKIITENCTCTSSCFNVDVGNIGFRKLPLDTTVLKNEKSLVHIDIIVRPPTIRYTRNVVKTPLSMLVNVGGSIGLFVGASLLTIVEIIYYFMIRPVGNNYMNRRRNKRIRKVKAGQSSPSILNFPRSVCSN